MLEASEVTGGHVRGRNHSSDLDDFPKDDLNGPKIHRSIFKSRGPGKLKIRPGSSETLARRVWGVRKASEVHIETKWG